MYKHQHSNTHSGIRVSFTKRTVFLHNFGSSFGSYFEFNQKQNQDNQQMRSIIEIIDSFESIIYKTNK